MITFDNEHYNKFQDSPLAGTSYLAYKDIKKLIDLYKVDMEKILDLGCASGRSTKFLINLAKNIYACDISNYAVDVVSRNITQNVFVNDVKANLYFHAPYSAIFSFFTFLHLTNEDEITSELTRSYNSLDQGKYLIIVTGHKNLFYKNYSSVECAQNRPNNDGDITKINLKKINCEVENCFWEIQTLVKLAEKCNFNLAGIHLPVGLKDDNKEYIDEYNFPPYVYLILRK